MKRTSRSAPLPQSDYTIRSVARACDVLACFRESSELLDLVQVAQRAGMNKVTAFRILATLAAKGLIEKVGPRAYRSRFRPLRTRRYLIGYAAQSEVIPFISTVTESLAAAARSNEVDLVVLNNRASRSVALRNADLLVQRKVDLAIEFQRIAEIAPLVSEKFSRAGIPLIAVDNPHPGAVYFGADNYKAGRIGGLHLGRWAVRHWGGQADEIILIQSAPGGPVLDARILGVYDGIVSVLPRSTKIPLFRYDTQARYENTLDAVRRHLRFSRARRILLGAVNDPSALAALEAFREFGREQQCGIIGQDAVFESRQEMRRPNTRLIGSVAYFPESYGERLLRLALDMLEDRPYPPAVFTQHRLVTPENVNSLYPNDLLMNRQALDWPKRGAQS
ncbi:MAG: substrate-binding domain-containing protein [Bryobacteraceae bacterium]